jgi:hypothetical protein
LLGGQSDAELAVTAIGLHAHQMLSFSKYALFMCVLVWSVFLDVFTGTYCCYKVWAMVKCHHCQGLGLQICFALMLGRLISPPQFWSTNESPYLGVCVGARLRLCAHMHVLREKLP